MTLDDVLDLVRTVHRARPAAAGGPTVAPASVIVGGAVTALGRLRAALDGWEADLVLALRASGADPGVVLATAQRVGWREAERAVGRADVLQAAPALRAAVDSGEVSGAHVDTIVHAVQSLDEQSRPALLDRAEFLAAAAGRAPSVGAFARTVRGEAERVRTDDGLARFERQRRATSMQTWVDRQSGMWRGRFALDPVTGLKADGRLQAAVDAMFADRTPDTCPADPLARQDHLRGLAFAALLTSAQGGHDEAGAGAAAGAGARRPAPVDVSIVIDVDRVDPADPERRPRTLYDFGLPVDIPLSALRALCANATITPILVRGGTVVSAPGRLNLGRTTRLANRAQRRALRALYPTCAIPGCETGYRHTQPHHVVWWRNGGRTDLDNLLPLCVSHHHAVHDHGWHVKLLPDRSLVVTLPDGTTMRTGPPRATA